MDTASATTFNATGATLTALDNLTGTGTSNTLNITDATGALAGAAPSGVTLTNIQTLNATSAGTIGSNGASSVAASNTYTFATPAAATDTVTFTYSGVGPSPVTFTTGATANTAAAAFYRALSSTTNGIVSMSAAPTVASATSSTAQSGTTNATLTVASVTGLAVGDAVSSGSTLVGTVSAIDTVNSIVTMNVGSTVSSASSAANYTFYHGNTVTVAAPVAGQALPALTFTTATTAADVPSVSATAASAGTNATTYDASGWTSLSGINLTTVGGSNFTAGTAAVKVTNTGGGTVTLVGGTSQSIVTDGGAVASSSATGAVSVTDVAQVGSSIVVKSGTDVTINAGYNLLGAITVGSASTTTGNATGTITGAVNVNSAAYTGYTAGAIAVNGGSTVNVTQTAAAKSPSSSSTTAPITAQGAVTVKGIATTSAVTVNQTAAQTGQNYILGKAAVAETISVKFTALAAGEAVTVGGLTLTASSTGSGMTAAQVASAFANLAKGAFNGGVNTSVATFTGQLGGTLSTTVSSASTSSTSVTVGSSAGVVVGDKLYAGTTLLGTVASITDGTTVVLAANAAQAVSSSTAASFVHAAADFTSGAANGDTVVFTSPLRAADTTDLPVSTTRTLSTPTVTELTKAVSAVTAVGKGTISTGAVTISDINYAPTGSASNGQGTKLGVIGTITANNFTTLTINNSGLSTLNVTGGSSDITINDGSALAAGSVLRSVTVNMGGQTGGSLIANQTNNYNTLNLNLTASSALANIDMRGVTAVNLSGTGTLSLSSVKSSSAGLTAAKTITLTGAVGLNGAQTLVDTATPGGKAVAATASLDLSTINGTLTSVDASATTGAVKVTVDSSATAIAGGSGNDTITAAGSGGTNSATTVSKSITTGAGNDTVILTSSAGTGALAISASISGGDGTDTLQMSAVDAKAVSVTNTLAGTGLTGAVFKSYVTGFEVLKIGGDALVGLTPTIADNTTIDLAQLGFTTNVNVAETVASTKTLTLDKFANGGTLTISANQSGTIALTNAAAWAATTPDVPASYLNNSANITLVGATYDSYNANGNGVYSSTTPGSVTGGVVTMAKVGTVNITASDIGSSVTGAVASHTLTLSDAMASVVNISGNAKLNLSLTDGTTVFAAPTTVNAASMTGALTFTAMVTTTGTTVIGGSGNDTLSASAGTVADKLNGGLGNDTLYSNKGATILTGGGGADTFVITGITAAKTIYTTITDFIVGDTLKLLDVSGTEKFVSTKVDLSALGGTATLSDAINAAISGTSSGVIKWFQFGGDTYVVENNGHANATSFTDNATTGDLVVKLSGLVDLSNAGFNAANQSLTLFG